MRIAASRGESPVSAAKKLQIRAAGQLWIEAFGPGGGIPDDSSDLSRLAHHIVPAYGRTAACRQLQGGENFEQRGLSGAVGADEGHDLAGANPQRHVVQHRDVRKRFHDPFESDPVAGHLQHEKFWSPYRPNQTLA